MTAADVEKSIVDLRPRVFDTYVLPAFMCGYAYKSKGMGKLARRLLFTAGVYMAMRSYSQYKAALLALTGSPEGSK